MNWEKIAEDKVLFDGEWRRIVEKTYKMPDGKTKTFEILDAKPEHRSVGIVAVTENGQVVIAEQFRPGPELVLQEIPAGLAEPDEDLELAAIRELKEETGYEVKREELSYLGPYWRDPYYNLVMHYFFAPNVRLASEQSLDEGEHVNVRLIPPAELLEIAKTGQTTESVGVLLARDYLEKYDRIRP